MKTKPWRFIAITIKRPAALLSDSALVLGQPAFGLDRGLAAHADARDGLAINVGGELLGEGGVGLDDPVDLIR